jgi:hypothetical protein
MKATEFLPIPFPEGKFLWSKKYTVLATTNNGFDMAFGMLKYGNGMYLLTSLHNETFFQVATNLRLMENLIYFAARWLKTKKW